MAFSEPVAWDAVSIELLRAVRGGRSQVAFSRRLGYRGNPVVKWEIGARFPTALEVVRACRVAGIDVDSAITHFVPGAADVWDRGDLVAWLRVVVGDVSHGELAQRSRLSRQQIGRALRGDSAPRLPEWLALVDAATGRVADLVGGLVDIALVPALADQAAMRRAIRQLAFDEPWSPGVLAVLAARPDAGADWVSACLSAAPIALSIAEAERLGALVAASGLLADAPLAGPTVDVATSDESQHRLREHWARVGAARVAAGRAESFSYNVFAVSRADLERIRSMQRAFFREVRAIVAESPPEVAAFLMVHSGPLEPS